eukprot:scaffold201491_cov37-Prasinocladus_malaysianus.AAC.1
MMLLHNSSGKTSVVMYNHQNCLLFVLLISLHFRISGLASHHDVKHIFTVACVQVEVATALSALRLVRLMTARLPSRPAQLRSHYTV